MKKIMILAVVAALAGLSLPQSVSAQTGSSTQDDQETQATPNTQGTGTNSQGTGSSADPYGTGSQGTGSQGTGTSSGSMGTGSSTGAVSNYTEIKATDLPSAVSASINEKFPEYKTEKVFRGKDGIYKVTLSKDNVKETVFFDQRGDAVKMQK